MISLVVSPQQQPQQQQQQLSQASKMTKSAHQNKNNFFFSDAHFSAACNNVAVAPCNVPVTQHNRHKHLKTKSDFDLRSPDCRAPNQTQLLHSQLQAFDDCLRDEGYGMSPPPTPKPRKQPVANSARSQQQFDENTNPSFNFNDTNNNSNNNSLTSNECQNNVASHRRSISLIVNSSFCHSQAELSVASKEPSVERKAQLDKCVRRMRWLAATSQFEAAKSNHCKGKHEQTGSVSSNCQTTTLNDRQATHEHKSQYSSIDVEAEEQQASLSCKEAGAILREISEEFAQHRRWTI